MTIMKQHFQVPLPRPILLRLLRILLHLIKTYMETARLFGIIVIYLPHPFPIALARSLEKNLKIHRRS